jgi:hypothetical protein
MSVAMVGVGVAAVGTIAQMNAAGDAADAQSSSAREANQMEMMAQQQLREDLSPWVESGRGANSLLNQYLGIGGAGSSAVTSMGLQTGLSPEQVRQQLSSRFTRTVAPAGPKFDANQLDPMTRMMYESRYRDGDPAERAQFEAQHLGVPTSVRDNTGANTGTQGDVLQYGQAGASTSEIDEEGLNAAIQQYYAEQEAANARAASDPNYGSLLRGYRNGAEFDSGPAFDRGPAYDRGADFSFTGKDLASEPGYQFGLNQGTQGIERGQAARGNFLSGAAMKELTRFNEDYAGTKFNEGFNRASSTYNTNQAGRLNEYNVNQAGRLNEYNTNLTRRQNEWNTNLGAYNQNRNSIYNFLTGVSNTGQASAARVGANNQQVANSVGNNLMSAGNAQAASIVSGSNALSSGLNQAANSLNSNNSINSAAGWNSLLSRGGGGGYSGYTGYVGQSDPIANLNTQNGWT